MGGAGALENDYVENILSLPCNQRYIVEDMGRIMKLFEKVTRKEEKHMKKLLIMGTCHGTKAIIEYAKSQGVYTIVTDYFPPEKSAGKRIADNFWMISTADLDSLEKKCRDEGVDAVISGVSDFNQEMTVELCNRLGIPCHCTKEAWHYSRDKSDFKALCREVNAPIPEDYFLSDKLTEEELAAVKFPVVVKPVDLSGNRGVNYCYNKDELVEAYRYAQSVSKSDRIIVERMLCGEEWYSTYAIANGEISLLALNAMYAQPGEPKNCYTVTTTVSRYVEKYINEINDSIVRVLRSVGCTDGIAWVQVMLDQDGHFYIIEMGYRMDGELMVIPYKEVCNFDTIKWMVDTALGIPHTAEDLPEPQTRAFSACATGMELWTNKSGRIMQVCGFEEMARIPGVYVETALRVGEEIGQYRPAGVITFATENCEEMCQLIQKVNETVHVYNENNEDVIIKYTDFDYLREVYQAGLDGE